MTKSEILQQLAAASNAARLDDLGQRIEALRSARIESAEQLASILEPLAQAMAALTDETRDALAATDRQSRELGEQFRSEVQQATMELNKASTRAEQVAEYLQRVGHWTEWIHYLLTVATGVITALLVSAFWLWLAPPTVESRLDAKAVADHLKPAVIEALKPSRGR